MSAASVAGASHLATNDPATTPVWRFEQPPSAHKGNIPTRFPALDDYRLAPVLRVDISEWPSQGTTAFTVYDLGKLRNNCTDALRGCPAALKFTIWADGEELASCVCEKPGKRDAFLVVSSQKLKNHRVQIHVQPLC